jgi:omega-6 fatty acid desaturase (delta-12 desaturase)
MTSSDLRGAWQILNTLVPYAALWVVAAWCLPRAPWLLLVVMPLQVLFLARSFTLLHDCGHASLFQTQRLNRAMGFLLGVVCGLPGYPWSRGHAFHHRHNGNWEKYRGPSALVSVQEYDGFAPWRQRFYRLLRHPLMLLPGGFFYLVVKPRVALLLGLLGVQRQWYTAREFRALVANNVAVVGLWVAMGWWLGPAAFWLIYGPVMAVAAAIVICVFFVQHNFPGSYAESTAGWDEMAGVLEGTSNLDLPPLLNWFSADIGCHAIHHLSSRIPNYRLREAQMAHLPLLAGVTRLRLVDLPSCFDCILWDPELGRLVSIKGRSS